MYKLNAIDKVLQISTTAGILYAVNILYSFDAIGILAAYQVAATWIYALSFNNQDGQFYIWFSNHHKQIWPYILKIKTIGVTIGTLIVYIYLKFYFLIFNDELLIFIFVPLILRTYNLKDSVARSGNYRGYYIKLILLLKFFYLFIISLSIYYHSKNLLIITACFIPILEIIITEYFGNKKNIINISKKIIDRKKIVSVYFQSTGSQAISLLFIGGDVMVASGILSLSDLSMYTLIRQISFLPHFLGSVNLLKMIELYSKKYKNVELHAFISCFIISGVISVVLMCIFTMWFIYYDLKLSFYISSIVLSIVVIPAFISQINNQILINMNLQKYEFYKTTISGLIFLGMIYIVYYVDYLYKPFLLSLSIILPFIFSNVVFFYLLKNKLSNFYYISDSISFIVRKPRMAFRYAIIWIK